MYFFVCIAFIFVYLSVNLQMLVTLTIILIKREIKMKIFEVSLPLLIFPCSLYWDPCRRHPTEESVTLNRPYLLCWASHLRLKQPIC